MAASRRPDHRSQPEPQLSRKPPKLNGSGLPGFFAEEWSSLLKRESRNPSERPTCAGTIAFFRRSAPTRLGSATSPQLRTVGPQRHKRPSPVSRLKVRRWAVSNSFTIRWAGQPDVPRYRLLTASINQVYDSLANAESVSNSFTIRWTAGDSLMFIAADVYRALRESGSPHWGRCRVSQRCRVGGCVRARDDAMTCILSTMVLQRSNSGRFSLANADSASDSCSSLTHVIQSCLTCHRDMHMGVHIRSPWFCRYVLPGRPHNARPGYASPASCGAAGGSRPFRMTPDLAGTLGQRIPSGIGARPPAHDMVPSMVSEHVIARTCPAVQARAERLPAQLDPAAAAWRHRKLGVNVLSVDRLHRTEA